MTLELVSLKRRLEYLPLTGVFIRLVSEGGALEDSIAGSVRLDGYIGISIKSKVYLAHRLAWFYMMGHWPDMIDHINKIRSDNRWDNLRAVSASFNLMNSDLRKDNTSGFKGINYIPSSNKWLARISYGGRKIHLGRFKTLQEAITARAKAEKDLYGRFSGSYIEEE